jgi:hypothetical protein
MELSARHAYVFVILDGNPQRHHDKIMTVRLVAFDLARGVRQDMLFQRAQSLRQGA